MDDMCYRAYLGTDTMRASRGLYFLRIDKATRKMTIAGSAYAVNPDYLSMPESGKFLYAAMDTVYYRGMAAAGVHAFSVAPDGQPVYINSQPAGGQLNCYVHVDRQGKKLYSASYMGGGITVHTINADGSLAPLERVIRHAPENGKYPSVHSVIITPDGRYLVATDVGLDKVVMYELESGQYGAAAAVKVPGRPRQTAFSPDGRYVYISTETGGEVFAFEYRPEADVKLRQIQRISTAPEGFSSPNVETAGIKMSPNGKMLIVSNRCPELNDLSVFATDGDTGLLTAAGRVRPPGLFPRDFNFSPDGRYVLVGMQFSDTVELFAVDYGKMELIHENGISLPNCSCVLFADESEVPNAGT